jgi:hypothetical protein
MVSPVLIIPSPVILGYIVTRVGHEALGANGGQIENLHCLQTIEVHSLSSETHQVGGDAK